jgi:hypothetical protein
MFCLLWLLASGDRGQLCGPSPTWGRRQSPVSETSNKIKLTTIDNVQKTDHYRNYESPQYSCVQPEDTPQRHDKGEPLNTEMLTSSGYYSIMHRRFIRRPVLKKNKLGLRFHVKFYSELIQNNRIRHINFNVEPKPNFIENCEAYRIERRLFKDVSTTAASTLVSKDISGWFHSIKLF